jgi:5-hydroxyisourate hydrolase-like protein (transthyretin family)
MRAPGLIEGSILDSSDKPAGNIRVEVLRLNGTGKPIYYAQKETMTDRDGRYRLSELPSGDFQVGINLFRPPDPKAPYIPTRWSIDNRSSIHLMPGEHKLISVIRLPPPSPVHKIEVEVRWPDGRPAEGVMVWGEVGDHAATSGKTEANGRAKLDVLEGVAYSVEAKILVGTGAEREVARSGATDLTPGREPIHLQLVLSRHSKEYR